MVSRCAKIKDYLNALFTDLLFEFLDSEHPELREQHAVTISLHRELLERNTKLAV